MRPSLSDNCAKLNETCSIEEGLRDVEAQLRVLQQRQPTELEVEVLQEIRVEANLGVLSALGGYYCVFLKVWTVQLMMIYFKEGVSLGISHAR